MSDDDSDSALKGSDPSRAGRSGSEAGKDSDEERRREGSPPESDSDSLREGRAVNRRHLNASSGADDRGGSPRSDLSSPSPSRETSVRRRRGDAYQRSIVDLSNVDTPLALLQMPSSVDVPLGPSKPNTDPLPPAALTSILYRLKPGLSQASIETAVANHGPVAAMPVVAESNARIVTWSDNSRTLMVGDEHFAVADERVQPEWLYVFRKSDDVQAYHGEVTQSYGVQPTTVNRKRTSALVALAPTAKKKGRQMQFYMEGGAELEEQEQKKKSLQVQRERAKLENKRRRMGERTVRPEARLTRSALEDDDDFDDDDDDNGSEYDNHDNGEDGSVSREREREREKERREREVQRREEDRAQRRREEEREARLRESKRSAAADERVDAVRRRKLGSRRVLKNDDDDDDDDDASESS